MDIQTIYKDIIAKISACENDNYHWKFITLTKQEAEMIAEFIRTKLEDQVN